MKLDFSSDTYSRCDDKGCDTYPMTYSRSGMFTSVALPQNATLLKAANDGSAFTDIATLWLAVHLSFGRCEPQ